MKPVMRPLVASALMLVALATVAACGSATVHQAVSEGNTKATAAAGRSASSSPSSSSSPAAASHVQVEKGATESAFCTDITGLFNASDDVAPDELSPTALRALFTSDATSETAALTAAPASILPQVQVMVNAFRSLAAEAAKVGYVYADLPANAADSFETSQVDTATSGIGTYINQNCASATTTTTVPSTTTTTPATTTTAG